MIEKQERLQFSYQTALFSRVRQKIISNAALNNQKLIIFVKYGESHNPHIWWGYNEAVLERASVIWALDCGDLKNKAVTETFPSYKPIFAAITNSEIKLEPLTQL
jgi:hypothetical protein